MTLMLSTWWLLAVNEIGTWGAALVFMEGRSCAVQTIFCNISLNGKPGLQVPRVHALTQGLGVNPRSHSCNKQLVRRCHLLLLLYWLPPYWKRCLKVPLCSNLFHAISASCPLKKQIWFHNLLDQKHSILIITPYSARADFTTPVQQISIQNILTSPMPCS